VARTGASSLASSEIPYVGLLGPVARRERMLSQIGPLASRLRGRLHSPVGLDLGANNPEAIALAIAAEIQGRLGGRERIEPLLRIETEGPFGTTMIFPVRLPVTLHSTGTHLGPLHRALGYTARRTLQPMPRISRSRPTISVLLERHFCLAVPSPCTMTTRLLSWPSSIANSAVRPTTKQIACSEMAGNLTMASLSKL